MEAKLFFRQIYVNHAQIIQYLKVESIKFLLINSKSISFQFKSTPYLLFIGLQIFVCYWKSFGDEINE